ncbi:unnamed protein product [Durusdinium trenchii]|uniref:Uncharacterized protein n=1 Tax=Durusdinium trenchii TaxID=1381693 RepID=A0ABP0JVB1_9DINO
MALFEGILRPGRPLEQRPLDCLAPPGSVLHRLAAEDDAAALRALLGADAALPADVAWCQEVWIDEDGRSPLHLAARANAAETVALLLEAAADVNQADRFGHTPLHHVAMCPQELTSLEVPWRLLDAEAEVHALGRCNDVPLHLAACYGHHALCALLLARWADPKLCDWSSATALQIAVQHQQLRTAEVLSEWRPLEVELPDASSVVVWLRPSATHAELCGRLAGVAGVSASAFVECQMCLPERPFHSTRAPEPSTCRDLLRHRRVRLAPVPVPAHGWEELWAPEMMPSDLSWTPCEEFDTAALSDAHPFAQKLMQFFDQHSSNFYSTAVQLLRVPSERLREFHEAISRLECQMLIPYGSQHTPRATAALARQPLGVLWAEARPEARPGAALAMLRSQAVALCGATLGTRRLQHVSFALAWARDDANLHVTGEKAIEGCGEETSVLAYLVAYTTAFPVSKHRSYRRHRWELHPHPPGFDLYVLGGAGRHQARPLAEYQLFPVEDAQLLPFAVVHVQRGSVAGRALSPARQLFEGEAFLPLADSREAVCGATETLFKQRKNSMIHDPHRMTRAALTARRLLVALFCARLLAAPVRTNDGVVLCPAGQRPDGQGRCVPVVCPPGTVTAFPAFAACVPCHAGGYANAQGTLCLACEDGISASGSTKCEACEGVFFNLQPDAPHERCEITAVSILTPVKFFLCLLGLFQLLAMARIYCLEVTDVSLQSGQTVISTLGRHFLRTSRGGRVDVPRVELQGTGVRGLDLAEFQVKVLGKEQLVLIHLEGKVEHWASSMGQLRLHFPQTLWQIRFLHTPLLAWVLLFLASAIAVGFGVTKLSILLSLSSAFLLSTILVSAGQKQRTPVALKRQQFLRLHSQLQPCERGPLRAMKLEKMKTFHEFFEMFIRDRSMPL